MVLQSAFSVLDYTLAGFCDMYVTPGAHGKTKLEMLILTWVLKLCAARKGAGKRRD